MSKFYNLYVPYEKTKIYKYIDIFSSLGFSGLGIVFSDERIINSSEVNKILSYCNTLGIKCYPRFHITSRVIMGLDEKTRKKMIFKLRNKFLSRKYIISIEDTLLPILTANEALKFHIITIVNPFFRKIIKLVNKPILFEYIPSEKLLSNSWLRKKLFILKLFVNKNILLISQDPSTNPLFPPKQISFFIYGLLGFSNISYNVVSTLPMKVVMNACEDYS